VDPTLTGPVRQQGGASAAAFGAFAVIVWLFGVALGLLAIAGMWKAFRKAGRPGWGAIVPIYNLFLAPQIGSNAGWWLLAFLIPIVNVVVAFKVNVDVARAFGRGFGFGVGLTILGFVFWPLLGFGDDAYRGTVVVRAAPVGGPRADAGGCRLAAWKSSARSLCR